ncbi:MAG: hypothetical protein JO142_00695 [Burkholderiales bacterium]|nr:hypothetical protein [Burkholderiales bacterium]
MQTPRKLRIQAAPRRVEDDEPSRAFAPIPVPPFTRALAVAGIAAFWLYYFGWVGPGGNAGLETGFLLFIGGQLPMWLTWLRGQIGRRH